MFLFGSPLLEIIFDHVSHPRPVEERHPWEAVDRKVPSPTKNHLADEAQYVEASGARS